MRENRVMRLLKEYWAYNREFTVRLGWIFPFLIIWRTFFPELYFGNRLTVLAEFSIFILMPVAFFLPYMIFGKIRRSSWRGSVKEHLLNDPAHFTVGVEPSS